MRASPRCPRTEDLKAGHHSRQHSARQCLSERTKPTGRPGLRLGNATSDGQPVLFEPPYSAMCLPAGRGDGSIADDVYALGVLLLCLALGHAPLMELDDATILRRKLELGTTPPWRATTACRRSSAIWFAACWRKILSIGRHRHCRPIRQARGGVGLLLGRHGGRSGPSSWRATRSGMHGRWPTRLQKSPSRV